ncbi:MAG: protein kinase [Vulcanimicrobiota bacterium]
MLPVGSVLAQRYRIMRQMARGGMSNIYLCEDQRLTGKKWVVKELDAQYQDPKERENAKIHFEREASLLANLEHRNLPKVIDYFHENGKHHLVMEFVDGEDLSRILSKSPGPLPEKQVIDWGIQIATVLYFLHCRKPDPIVFRDLKPSNIILSGNIVKLIDFGIARHFSPTKKGDTMRIGSPGYAPPEQYSGQTDPRSDIYSLGVTMYQLVTKYDPANTQTPFKFPPIQSINPAASPKLIQIIEKMIQMEPEKRYQAAIEVKRDLQMMIGADITSPNMFGGQKTIPSIVMPQSSTMPPQLSGATIPSAGQAPPMPAPPQKSGSAGKQKIAALKPAGKGTAAHRAVMLILLFAGVAVLYFSWKFSLFSRLQETVQSLDLSAENPLRYNADLPEDQFVRKGIVNLNNGDLKKAFSNFNGVREKYSDDGEVLLYLNNAYLIGSGEDRVSIGFEAASDGSRANVKERERYRGAALAQSMVNKYGGISLKDGIKIEIIPRITKNENGRIVKAAKELLERNELLFLMGAFPQQSERNVAEAAEKSDCAVISLASPPSQEIPSVFLSIAPPEYCEYSAMGRLASETIKPSSVALFFRKDCYVNERRAIVDNSGKEIKISEYPFESDGSAAVAHLRGNPADMIVLVSSLSNEDDINAVKSLMEALKKDRISTPMLVNPLLYYYLDEEAADLCPQSDVYTVIPSAESQQTPRIFSFFREYRNAYGRFPDSYESTVSHDGVILAAAAVEKGGEPSRTAVLNYLKELGNGGTFEGACTSLTFKDRRCISTQWRGLQKSAKTGVKTLEAISVP